MGLSLVWAIFWFCIIFQGCLYSEYSQKTETAFPPDQERMDLFAVCIIV